jgi:phage terminase large subunit-like protein
MVQAIVQAAAAEAKLRVPFKEVKASRGKVVRAEPVSTLYEQGKVHHVGAFTALEDQLISFTTHGYMGDGSPDRADALIWGLTELFPRVVTSDEKIEPVEVIGRSLMRDRVAGRQGGGARRIW